MINLNVLYAGVGYKAVTKANPCIICGKPSWCSIFLPLGIIVCRRAGGGGGVHKTDKNGCDYWIFKIAGINARPSDVAINIQRRDIAPSSTLNSIYFSLLSQLPLTDEHRRNLGIRGLSNEEIDRRGYRSLPIRGRSAIAKALIENYGLPSCSRTPGLFFKDDKYWTIAGPSGILIPVRNHDAQIIALKVRVDQAIGNQKYFYLSSKKYNGVGSGAPIHVPLASYPVGELIRVTEGELKADIATSLNSIFTISIPGASAWKYAIPVLKNLDAKVVRVALDMDWQTNRLVYQSLVSFVRELRQQGFRVEVETWS